MQYDVYEIVYGIRTTKCLATSKDFVQQPYNKLYYNNNNKIVLLHLLKRAKCGKKNYYYYKIPLKAVEISYNMRIPKFPYSV